MSGAIAAAAVSPPEAAARLRRNLSWLVASQGVTWTTALAWTLYVPRVLGPSGTGLIVTGWAAGGVLSAIVGLGTRTYMVKEIAAEPHRARGLIGAAFALRTLSIVPTAALAILIVHLARYGSETAVIIYLTCAWVLLSLFLDPLQAYFQGTERMQFLVFSDILNKSALSLIAIVLVTFGVHATGLVAMSVVVMVLVLLLNAFWVRRFGAIEWHTTARELRRLFRDSLAYWTYALCATLYLWIDSLMLSALTDPKTVGVYGAPTKIFTTLMFIPAIICTAWLPRLAAAFKGGEAQLEAASQTPIRLVLVLSLPVCAGALLFADPLIPMLYGRGFTSSVPVLRLLALAIPPTYLGFILNQVLVAGNRQWVWTRMMALATVVNPLLNYFLIRLTASHGGNGAIGAALSLLVTELLVITIGIALLRHLFTLSTAWRVARAALACAGMVVAGLAARPFGLLAEIVAAGTTIVLLAAVLRVVTPEEQSALAAIAARVPGLRRVRAAENVQL